MLRYNHMPSLLFPTERHKSAVLGSVYYFVPLDGVMRYCSTCAKLPAAQNRDSFIHYVFFFMAVFNIRMSLQ